MGALVGEVPTPPSPVHSHVPHTYHMYRCVPHICTVPNKGAPSTCTKCTEPYVPNVPYQKRHTKHMYQMYRTVCTKCTVPKKMAPNTCTRCTAPYVPNVPYQKNGTKHIPFFGTVRLVHTVRYIWYMCLVPFFLVRYVYGTYSTVHLVHVFGMPFLVRYVWYIWFGTFGTCVFTHGAVQLVR